MGQRLDLGLEHLMHVPAGHVAFQRLARRDAIRLDVLDHAFLDQVELLKLLVEMAGQQHHGVLELALAVDQRALAETADHGRGADRNRDDQQRAAQHQPLDRTAV